MEEVLAADGKTCDYFMNEMMSKDQQHRQQPGQQQQPPKDSKETGKPPLQRPGNYALTSGANQKLCTFTFEISVSLSLSH